MSYFDEVCDSLAEITKKKKEYFLYFRETGNFGWEKWLQIELANNLRNRGHDTEVEKPYPYDKTTNVPKPRANFLNCFIDVAFKKKNFTNNWVSAIELKVTRGVGGLKPVLGDLEKISSIKRSAWNIRSVIAVLVLSKGDRETKFVKILDGINAHENAVHRVHEFSIGEDSFNVVVIGWEVRLINNMSRESYKEWLSVVRRCYGRHNVSIVKS